MKSMGRKNMELRNSLLDFKAKLIKFMTTKGEDFSLDLLNSLKKKDYEESIKIAKKIYNTCYDSMIDDVNYAFENLINVCDLTNNFSCNLIAPTRLIRAKYGEYHLNSMKVIRMFILWFFFLNYF